MEAGDLGDLVLVPGRMSFFKGLRDSVPARAISLEQFIGAIRSGKFASRVEWARSQRDVGEEAYKKAKALLPAVTPFGCFGRRCREGVVSASGMFVADIDNGDNADVVSWEALRDRFAGLSCVVGAFLSPRGDGLKLIYLVDPRVPLVESVRVMNGLLADGGVVADESGKDVSRLCFLSYDAGAYLADADEVKCEVLGYEVWRAGLGAGDVLPLVSDHVVSDHDRVLPVVVSDRVAVAGASVAGASGVEDDGAKMERYLGVLRAGIGRLGYDDWLLVIAACVAFYGEAEAVAVLRGCWAEEREGEYARKVRRPMPCKDPFAMLGRVAKNNGLSLKRVGAVRAVAGAVPRGLDDALADAGADGVVADGDAVKPTWRVYDNFRSEDYRGWSDFGAIPGELRALAVEEYLGGIYYDQGGSYYVEGADGYVSMTEGSVKVHLRGKGADRARRQSDRVTLMEFLMDRVRMTRAVDYAGPLAGYRRGIVEVGGGRVLVTADPHLLVPKRGRCLLLLRLIGDLMAVRVDPHGREQRRHFMGWLKMAFEGFEEALVNGYMRPGHVLVLSGPPAAGKSLLKMLVVKMLGGRQGCPWTVLSGESRFNADLAGKEVLVIDDDTGETDPRVRRNIGGRIKSMLFSGLTRVESKGREPIEFSPFWRMIMCLNDDPEDLLVLPLMTEGIKDKLMLMHCGRYVCPEPFYTAEEKRDVVGRMVAEIPAFLWLLKRMVIDDGMRDDRTGVVHFHHPFVLNALGEMSPEGEMLELMDVILPLGMVDERVASDWKRYFCDEEGRTGRAYSASREMQRILGKWGNACATYLGRLSKSHPHRVQKVAMRKGKQFWRVFALTSSALLEGDDDFGGDDLP